MLDAESSKIRETILGIVGTNYPHAGIEHFGGVSIERIERLIAKGFFTVRDKEIYSRFLKFMRKYTQFRAFGYVVSPARHDTRVVVEGLEAFTTDTVAILDFKNTFSDAVELSGKDYNIKCKYKL